MNKTIRINRLWRDLVSIRDYVVQDCIKKNHSVRVLYGEKSMTLTPKDLRKGFQTLGNKKFNSKYGGKYELVDFKWLPSSNKGNPIDHNQKELYEKNTYQKA